MHCRYDILLNATQPIGNYWINVLAEKGSRVGSPGGYGVLRYAGSNVTLPTSPIAQPESISGWSSSTLNNVSSSCDLLVTLPAEDDGVCIHIVL